MEVIRIMKYKVITAMVLAAAMTMAGCAGQGAAPKQEAAQKARGRAREGRGGR